MSFNTTQVTRFPGGLAQYVLFGVGSTAGAQTVAGVKATDRLIGVETITLDASGYCTAVADITSECSVTGLDTITNTTTDLTHLAIVATVARTIA